MQPPKKLSKRGPGQPELKKRVRHDSISVENLHTFFGGSGTSKMIV